MCVKLPELNFVIFYTGEEHDEDKEAKEFIKLKSELV